MAASPKTLRSLFAMLLLVTGLAAPARMAFAQGAPAQPATPEQAEALAAQARDLNRQGIALLDAGDIERALDRFLKSRAVYPSTKNTANAAICLDRLGRYDEALELYEELLVKYAGGLDEEDRKAVAPAMAALRRKVGSVVVTSTAGGTVVIDGRTRGKLPLATPLRALTGKRLVRVVKPGYETFEKSVDVAAGQTVTVDAKLVSLKGVGLLVVEDAVGGGLDVFVDRVRVGATPWEGSIPPGRHLLWTRRGDQGTAPEPVVVIEGQTTLIRAEPKPLGPPIRVQVEPRTATLDLEGTQLGVGVWEGRLPAGRYAITAAEPGYQSRVVEITSDARGSAVDVSHSLVIDPDHPRWPKRGKRWVDAFGGYIGGPGLDSQAEESCPDRCDTNPPVVGFIAGLRGGYRFPFALAIELSGGYMRLGSSFQRRVTDGAGTPVDYRLQDDIRVHGPFAAVGVSYEWALGNAFALRARANIGLLLAIVTDPVDGTAKTTGQEVGVVLEDRNASATAGAPFVGPEFGVGKRIGPIDVGLSLGLAVFLADGPTLDREGRFGAQTAEGTTDDSAVENAQESRLLEGERAYGRFLVWSPQLSLGTTF